MASARAKNAIATMSPFLEWLRDPQSTKQLAGQPGYNDMMFGDPHAIFPEILDAMRRSLEPQDDTWFDYKRNDPTSQNVVATALSARYAGLAFRDEDVHVTNGAIAGLHCTFSAIADPGDEIVFCSPPWFFYESQMTALGITPLVVKLKAPAFELSAEAILAAVTPRTRAVVINNPHNCSGRVFTDNELAEVARALSKVSQERGTPIYIVSDEAYRDVTFDGVVCPSPVSHYPHTIIVYTYAKKLLIPGQRIGYVALSPKFEAGMARELNHALDSMQMNGWCYPNNMMRYCIGDLENYVLDTSELQAKRDMICASLEEANYTFLKPEGTFYIMTMSPIEDDVEFVKILAKHKLLVVPGEFLGLPGWIRMSLSASMEMVEAVVESQSLKKAMEECT